MEKLTTQEFKEKIFDFENEKTWSYRGELPAIIDFYADWCGPCRQLGPVLEKVAEEFAGRVVVYKVDTDKEQELAGAFGIQSIPSLLFIPRQGQPQMAVGGMSREGFAKAIDQVRLNPVPPTAGLEVPADGPAAAAAEPEVPAANPAATAN
jgi:thioredoxin 1